VDPNRFQGNVFTPPQKTVVGKLVKNIEKKLKFNMALASIFSTPIDFAGFEDFL
jgi:hypothetical protein